MSEETMTASEHREAAAQAAQRVQESWERSDTDGFLSQWAGDLSARKHQLAAEILDAGGVHEFKGLFDAQNRRIKAKLVSVVDQYHGFGREHKSLWLLLDERDQKIAWVPAYARGPRSKLAQMGLHEDDELAPAVAVFEGRGHGLSGTAWVAAKRTDAGYPEGAVIYGSK